MIILDIDVTKLDKARFRDGRNGQKYCDLVLIDHPKEKSDGFVKQGVSKEEREARVEMPIIGNWRHVGGRPNPARPEPQQRGLAKPSAATSHEPEDDIPF